VTVALGPLSNLEAAANITVGDRGPHALKGSGGPGGCLPSRQPDTGCQAGISDALQRAERQAVVRG